jgi:hypothetical protein
MKTGYDLIDTDLPLLAITRCKWSPRLRMIWSSPDEASNNWRAENSNVQSSSYV